MLREKSLYGHQRSKKEAFLFNRGDQKLNHPLSYPPSQLSSEAFLPSQCLPSPATPLLSCPHTPVPKRRLHCRSFRLYWFLGQRRMVGCSCGRQVDAIGWMCPHTQVFMLKRPQREGIWRWGFWEVVRSRG